MRASQKNSRGSVTLVALCLAIVIGISLASYLALCQQSLLLSTRTIQLSKARQLAETGLEEALWSLNAAANPNTSVSSIAWSNATWTVTGANKSCTLTGYDLGEGATGKITITIADFNGPMPITNVPAVPNPVITAAATVTNPALGVYTKTLTATAKPAPLFANAIGVINGGVALPAGTVIDSWNSDPDKDYNVSPPGTAAVAYSFTAGTTSNYAAVIAASAITLNGDATICGYAATFGTPINNPSANGVIQGPASPATPKIDPTRVSKSAFIPSFTVTAPFPPAPATWFDLPSNAAWGTSRTIGIAGATQYWRTVTPETGMTTFNGPGDDLFLDGTKTLIIDGPVVLVVNEDFELKDNAQIEITSTGRLELYVQDDVKVSSSLGFLNSTNEPRKLGLFCPNVSNDFDFTYSSPAVFNGVLYSNDSNQGMNFVFSPEIYGAIMTGCTPVFDPSGLLKIHYDLALQNLPKGWFKGVITPFIIDQVTETVLP